MEETAVAEMADKLNSLIAALENIGTYDRENALIDLYIFLISQKRSLPKAENSFLFVELSNWRDCLLRDGVEAYYETKDVDELNFLEKNMKQYALHEVCKKCMSGIYIHQENGDFSSLDNYISDNEWTINDFLVELAKE